MLLYFGLMAILFAKNTRFDDIRNRLNKLKKKKAKLMTMIVLLLSMSGFAQMHTENDGHDHAKNIKPSKAQIDSILGANITPIAHVDKFAKMVVQDYDGRMKPMHTYASEMLRKLSKKDTYEGFTATQIYLSIQESPILWYNVPIIYLTPRKADSIRTIIGVSNHI